MAKHKAVEAVVLFYPASVEGRWVAHCLDFDIVGTGDDPGDAFTELLGTLEVQLTMWEKLGDTAEPPKKAPKKYWDAAKTAIELPAPELGALEGWAQHYTAQRKKKLRAEIARRVPEKCKGKLVLRRSRLLATA